jgi:hypothetical protein
MGMGDGLSERSGRSGPDPPPLRPAATFFDDGMEAEEVSVEIRLGWKPAATAGKGAGVSWSWTHSQSDRKIGST